MIELGELIRDIKMGTKGPSAVNGYICRDGGDPEDLWWRLMAELLPTSTPMAITERISRAMELIERKYYTPEKSTANNPAPPLSNELDTPSFHIILSQLISSNCISIVNGRYFWRKSKALYGYFMLRVLDELTPARLGGPMRWSIFDCFGNHKILYKEALDAATDYKNSRRSFPRGKDLIDCAMIEAMKPSVPNPDSNT